MATICDCQDIYYRFLFTVLFSIFQTLPEIWILLSFYEKIFPFPNFFWCIRYTLTVLYFKPKLIVWCMMFSWSCYYRKKINLIKCLKRDNKNRHCGWFFLISSFQCGISFLLCCWRFLSFLCHLKFFIVW